MPAISRLFRFLGLFLLLSACASTPNGTAPSDSRLPLATVRAPLPSALSSATPPLVAFATTFGRQPIDNVFGAADGFQILLYRVRTQSPHVVTGSFATLGDSDPIDFNRPAVQSVRCGAQHAHNIKDSRGETLNLRISMGCRRNDGRRTSFLWLNNEFFGAFTPPEDPNLTLLICEGAVHTVALYVERVGLEGSTPTFLISDAERKKLILHLHCLSLPPSLSRP